MRNPVNPGGFSLAWLPMGVPFGRYTLMKRLGAGGMGEVFLARAEGSDQELVLKRILPHLTENPRFLRLFLDETRIASRLVHPNIARIFELGEVEGTWFVAMELVDGKDLRELLKRAREQGHHLPLEVAVGIAIEIAKGLSHAHAATDSQGRSLHVVHRDVSPHNILIGRTGDVKLIDFGVAKAANKSVQTGTGILKGKFPYMAPEQAHAKPVDPRTDVFALGIVLWEMICARYLFRGKTDAATLKLVREVSVPVPSSLRDDVPEALDRVVMKALRKEPRDRYPTAEAFREALATVLAGLPPPDLEKWVREYEDVPGLDDSSAGEELEPPSESGTQLESHEKQTVAESPSRATNPVRPRPTETPSDSKDSSDEKARSQLKQLLTQVSGRPTNIGPQTTSFVGRVAELADLHQLFRQGARFLTLLGPGGTGKTRLSLQFGSQLVTHFQAVNEKGRRRGGVWFCDLTEARDKDGVCAAVARALGVPLMPSDPIKQLGHAILARGETLLVLDNFEQVVAAAASTLGAWLAAAPLARFVVTSRELLRVSDETVFEVPPLRVPREARDARSAEAVELFIERARSGRPGWEPTEAELVAISEIVRQLDGMPLAIELAASRMSVLSPTQLVQRLPRRFDVLVQKGAVDRQATLRGAIDWSWNNLSPSEASALAQLSVFRGGFAAEAVDEVVSLPGSEGGPLEALMTLRSKSLVRAYFPTGDEAQTRFGLYESIREYAREKLQQRPERDQVLARHTKYFLELGARLAEGGESSKGQLDNLDLERENLNTVFQRAVESDAAEQALNAVLALDPLLTMRGPFGVHLQMLDAVVGKLAELPRLRTAALETRSRARLARGRAQDAQTDLLEADELAQRVGDRNTQGRIAMLLASVERLQGQRGEARQSLNRGLEILREVGDLRMEGRTVSNLAVLQHEFGEDALALETYNRALEIHREAGDRRYEGITLANLGVLQQALGLLKAARANYQAALGIHRELGSRRSEGISHINLGDLAAELEQPGQALAHYESALELVRDVGARRFEGIALSSLGSLHLQYGEYDDAMRRLPEAIDVLREVGDVRYTGLTLGIRAATTALLGEMGPAEEDMAEATRLLTEVGDLSFLDALDLYRAHLELGHALATGSGHQAAVLDERIRKRIAHVERPGPADEAHPTGTPSPADRSEHVRAALRSLRGALEDNGRQG
jgi:predicted ATPase/serine/threonine protein kinase/Tfp pilus assembly protein PilF